MDSELIDGLVAARSDRDRASARFSEHLVHAFESGLPQREIARAVGVTQPAVSQMIAAERARRMSLQGPVRMKLDRHRGEIIDIAREHGARHLRVFGSVAEGRDTVDSDLDLLVSLPRTAGMLDVASLGDALAEALGAPVDVVAEHMVKRDQLAALKRRAVPL
jgi:predicted nucleotidyltransferase